MRHRLGYRKLNKTTSHRKAMFANMAASLIEHEQIVTTLPKAKEMAPLMDKLVTLAKKGDLNARRQALSKVRDEAAVRKLFDVMGERYKDRNGGYTRILRLSGSRMGLLSGSSVGDIPELEYKMEGFERKLRLIGNRLGDNASRVIFELIEEVEEEKEITPRVTVSEEKK